MARVRDVQVDEVPADVRPIYERFVQDYGPFMNQVKVFAHRPPALKHIMGLLLDLYDEKLLPKRYLEIALVVVSKLNECSYCVSHHTPRLVDHGFLPDAVARILDPDVPGFDEVDLLVRDYAVQVTTNPQRIRDQVFVALRKHFSEEQIVELTLRTALCGFFNRFNDALMIDIEDGVVEDMLSRGSSLSELPSQEREGASADGAA
ncbi:MAG: carboxymuconolactone decarboxylase family protein [Rubrivivax sp.]|nr:carboxymuconolactone decarboxylase family protein [Rubrivivax sp.]MBK7260472.1 carboxymuconolactone decarboxylase family protein [Rubrivivax sp.]MBK8526148.1 carboxymuconolactone decarboxylase family protein [Rubrivivax sp.]